ncbi:hypothetical protein [Sellimonas intestinalis]|uniref:hypothetical protein n=1 Tax=Sellimonas intestinalis TaxID=1653434 RepID=UPI003994FC9B
MGHILEKNTAEKGKAKKQVPLRLSQSLYNEIAQWAEDDFRSMNGQIEYLLTECVKYRKKELKKQTVTANRAEPLMIETA